ncbi:MAG: DUF2298 domain-containing protein [Haloferacaceae archaeon]
MEYVRVVVWLVAYAALAGAGLPIAARLFPWLDGRGAGFAVPISLVLLTTGAYWVGHVSITLGLAAGVLLVLLVAGVALLDLAAVRERGIDALGGGVPVDVELDRSSVREAAVVFALAFLLVVAIRAVDPAVHAVGGEKFLDFGLLQSLARADALPPQDVWFAGEPVRYYYGGHLMASLLARLTLTPPAYAYNLALAGFYAMLVTAAYDLAAAVGAHRGVPRRVAGAFAAFFVGVASNLVTAGRLVFDALSPDLQRQVAEAVASESGRATVEELLGASGRFSYWTASRVIPGTINEFPLFAWLNGDLHAHMMGTPFLLLAAALAFGYFRTPTRQRWRRRVLVFAAVPVDAGLQAVVDTWSFPSVFGLLFLAVALAPADPLTLLPDRVAAAARREVGVVDADLSGRGTGSLRAEALRPVAAAVVVGIAGLVGLVLAAPFLAGAAGGREVAILPASARSGLGGLLLVHGAFVVAFAAYLLARLRVERPVGLAVALAAFGWAALAVRAPVLLLSVPLLVAGWAALRMRRAVGFETLLIVAGAGLVTIVEFVYVREQAGPLRMNTVFKTYMQVWALWGTAAGVAVPGLLGSTEPLVSRTRAAAARAVADGGAAATRAGKTAQEAAREWPQVDGLRGALGSLLVVALLLSTALYAGFALSAHFGGRQDPATLDATAFVARDHPDYAPAIAYVDALEGQPTMVSAPATSRCLDLDREYPCEPGMYGWHSSPAASLTGVPTVAGWTHEVGYRGSEAYFSRARDVDAIYTGSVETRARLLRTYDVQYVWVGGAERARYGEMSFEGMPGVEPVVRTDAVTVYRVDQARLPT